MYQFAEVSILFVEHNKALLKVHSEMKGVGEGQLWSMRVKLGGDGRSSCKKQQPQASTTIITLYDVGHRSYGQRNQGVVQLLGSSVRIALLLTVQWNLTNLNT